MKFLNIIWRLKEDFLDFYFTKFTFIHFVYITFTVTHIHQIPDMQYPAIEALGPLDFGGDNADVHAENDRLHQGTVSKDSIAKILH